MNSNWTFGQKLAAGFGMVALITLVVGWVSLRSSRVLVEEKDRVITVNAENLILAQKVETAVEWMGSAARGYLLTRDEKFLENYAKAKREFADALARLKEGRPEERPALEGLERTERDYAEAIKKAFALRRAESRVDAIGRVFDSEVYPIRQELKNGMEAYVAREEMELLKAKQEASRKAEQAQSLMAWMSGGGVLLAALLAAFLARTLSSQVGAAVRHVQSSSSELQAAANQQATGAREQASSMNEISTTISELLATSRQIAESAQRVAQIASQTSQAAGRGDQTVGRAQESINAIRRQVDLIVTHMLELGKKSQQIGGILEIINELSEQTNILSINASVEAAGAGEAGRRFAVVADEIRKLADRVGGSTKEIRGLIDEVRAAVNTTVMATEGGAKAAEAGTRQFGEVTASLKDIAGLVGTSSEAAREIELSTKQQATAVEQVNVAISNVAQATRENEASSTQTLQTAVELATLSQDLGRLVQASAAARA